MSDKSKAIRSKSTGGHVFSGVALGLHEAMKTKLSAADFESAHPPLQLATTNEKSDSPELQMALRFFGYGCWSAPYWFIGLEEGKGPRESADNSNRVEAWLQLGKPEVCDCLEFHNRIGEENWHGKRPKLQRTWRPLILLLMTYLDRDHRKEKLREYQSASWGRECGETCIIELSGIPARSVKTIAERRQFREDRIETIRERIATYRPRIVVMYGLGGRESWERIAESAFHTDSVLRRKTTLFVLAPHPNARGRTDLDWVALGKKLNRQLAVNRGYLTA